MTVCHACTSSLQQKQLKYSSCHFLSLSSYSICQVYIFMYAKTSEHSTKQSKRELARGTRHRPDGYTVILLKTFDLYVCGRSGGKAKRTTQPQTEKLRKHLFRKDKTGLHCHLTTWPNE